MADGTAACIALPRHGRTLRRMGQITIASTTGDSQLQFADVHRRLRAIFIGSIGNLVEWYDFYAYAAFALYFAGAFFPGGDAVVQQLNAAVLFAIGFIVRPIGGWLFGHLADRYGRRGALMLSVLPMCPVRFVVRFAKLFSFRASGWRVRLAQDRGAGSWPQGSSARPACCAR